MDSRHKRQWFWRLTFLHGISTICQSTEYILELYIRIQIRINQLLIFIEWVTLPRQKSLPCWDLNLGPPKYQADVLPIELSRVGFIITHMFSFFSQPK